MFRHMLRNSSVRLIFTLTSLLPLASQAGAAEAPGKLWIRDAMTGIAIPDASVDGTKADPSGRLSLPSKAVGEVEIRAAGYKPMTIRPALGKAVGESANTVWLMPTSRPEALRPEVIEAKKIPNTAMLHGHVVSVETGRPVAGATVRLDGSNLSATTNRDGYFVLYPKGTRVVTPETVPEFADLVISAPGHASVRLAHIALIEEDFHYIVDLRKGSGETVRDMSHKLYPIGFEGVPHGSHMEEPLEKQAAEAPGTAQDLLARLSVAEKSAEKALIPGGLTVINPPDQILVSGYGWFPLEVYVSNGLCSEWIASWNYEALFAGSIAYRSYGSWYQINQGSICNTTSCQVFRNAYNSRCDVAAQRTTGILLQRGGAVARSEYSAENNSLRCSSYSCVNVDLSCGDGRAGSPAAGWPCLSDGHLFDQGTGRCCFGHGRGMCQWGTQAWSRSGWLWNRMTDHYYNASGAGSGNRTMFMTSPFNIVNASPSTTSVFRGGTFTISGTVRSYTDWNQPNVMIGASIVGPGTYSDPGHDNKVTILARTSFSVQSRDTGISRLFTVPSTALPGTYDLLVALWFDTNGNNVIDSNDKPLRTLRVTGALVVN